MRTHVLALAHDFCTGERLKLRRYLADRLPCELDLTEPEVEAELAALAADGWIRLVDISHYDPASEDISVEPAVVALPRLLAAG